MDFYQLTYFKKVAESGSISRAAEKLLLTQPAVSKQIKKLENELGERLFDRIGKKVFLTHAGEKLYTHADNILRSVAAAKTAVRDLSEDCSGELIIGASDHISIHRLPSVLKSYITSFPKVDLKLRCHRSEAIHEMVARNQVDLGIITLPKPEPTMIIKTIWKDTMSLVFVKNHPLRSLQRVKLKDTLDYGMILTETGTETRSYFDAAFAEKGLRPHVSMEVAYIETIKALVRAGLGISILPDKAVESEVKSGELVKTTIIDAKFSRNLGVIYLKDKFLSRPVQEFLNILSKA